MPTFEIVCLANSRKMGGRCVAGLTRTGEWIRPVSGDEDGTLYQKDYLLDSGSEAALLDVVRVSLGEHVPEPHQPENWRVAKRPWQHIDQLEGEAARHFLHDHAQVSPEILGNRSDRVSWDRLVEVPATASLVLIAAQDPRWNITTSMRGNGQTRVLFRLGDAEYDLSITDPLWEARLRGLPFGMHPLTAAGLGGDQSIFLTISLSEPFQGSCFKLVAAVIAVP